MINFNYYLNQVEVARLRLTELRPLDDARSFDNPRAWNEVEPGYWISSDDNVAVVAVTVATGNRLFLTFWRDESSPGYRGTDKWRRDRFYENPETACAAIDALWDSIYG